LRNILSALKDENVVGATLKGDVLGNKDGLGEGVDAACQSQTANVAASNIIPRFIRVNTGRGVRVRVLHGEDSNA
jgi:chorismate synthase